MNATDHDREHDAVLLVATRVADGTSLDDPAFETATGEARATLRELRAIAEIAQAHRRVQSVLSGDLAAPLPRWWGHLELLERIGEGVFGEVYRARDPDLDCDVAVKLLKHDISALAGDRFIHEARLLAQVQNRHLPHVRGAGHHDGRAGFWMDYVPGKTLEQLLEDVGALSAEEAMVIGVQVCEALASLHAANIIHRDVKSTNIVRDREGIVILMDLGASAEVGEEDLDRPLPLAGTPHYIAPEVLDNQPPGPTSDVYSVGVLLYHLVTRSYPVQGETLREIRQVHRAGRTEALHDVRPGLPESFRRVVARATDADPRRRYPSAGALGEALERALAPTRDPAWRRLLATIRQPRFAVPIAAAAALLIVFAVGQARRTFSVDAELYRLATDGRQRPLVHGATVVVGDEVFLEIETSRPVYLYVLNEDDQGRTVRMYPLPEAVGTPLAAGHRHRLPEARSWVVDSAGGREHILMVASRKRMPELEQTGEVPTEKGPGDFRGLNKLAPRADSIAGDTWESLLAGAAPLGDREERARDVWIRRIELVNAGSR